jgi:ribosomal protein L7/L12
MKITKINVPAYRVDKKLLNHFELLKLQTDIANKRKKGNVSVKCLTTGKTFKILKSGSIDFRTEAYDLMVSLVKELKDAIGNTLSKLSKEEIETLLHEGKLYAVKMHKERTGKSLYEAKKTVDEFAKSKLNH